MRWLTLLVLSLCAGCTSYVTPGGPARLQDIDRADITAVAARKPSPHFPANLIIARVQASGYSSYSATGYGEGNFSVVTTQELLDDSQAQGVTRWPSIQGVAPLNRLLLPTKLQSLDDLRLGAAKLQADVLWVYTVDTTFQIQGRGFGPLTLISLGTVPDRDAYVTSTASAVFIDVRTGFTYGAAEATAKANGLSNVWGASDTVDRKRLETEKKAFDQLVAESEKTWAMIVKTYQPPTTQAVAR